MATRTALHFVLKIGARKKNVEFFRDLLGMEVLRHEEFNEMCNAQCNGPYDGKWSKTMIGYGPESGHFVLELTYNYGVSEYKLGNDLVGIKIESARAYKSIVDNKDNWIFMHKNPETVVINSPDGYLFEVENAIHNQEIVSQVSLLSSNLSESKAYWHGELGMNLDVESKFQLVLSFSDSQTKLCFVSSPGGQPVRHEKAFGRIAFSCPDDDLVEIQDKMDANKRKVLTRFVKLDTPGKASVCVIILADPDGHEICFVGAPGFDQLSQVDPKANQLIETAIAEDKSDEWFSKKGKEKEKHV